MTTSSLSSREMRLAHCGRGAERRGLSVSVSLTDLSFPIAHLARVAPRASKNRRLTFYSSPSPDGSLTSMTTPGSHSLRARSSDLADSLRTKCTASNRRYASAAAPISRTCNGYPSWNTWPCSCSSNHQGSWRTRHRGKPPAVPETVVPGRLTARPSGRTPGTVTRPTLLLAPAVSLLPLCRPVPG